MNNDDRTTRPAGERDADRRKSPATWTLAAIGFAIVLGILGWGLIGSSDKGMTSRPNTGTSETVGSTAGSPSQVAPSGSSGTTGQPAQNPGPAQTNR
jgi:hypothetical protein